MPKVTNRKPTVVDIREALDNMADHFPDLMIDFSDTAIARLEEKLETMEDLDDLVASIRSAEFTRSLYFDY